MLGCISTLPLPLLFWGKGRRQDSWRLLVEHTWCQVCILPSKRPEKTTELWNTNCWKVIQQGQLDGVVWGAPQGWPCSIHHLELLLQKQLQPQQLLHQLLLPLLPQQSRWRKDSTFLCQTNQGWQEWSLLYWRWHGYSSEGAFDEGAYCEEYAPSYFYPKSQQQSIKKVLWICTYAPMVCSSETSVVSHKVAKCKFIQEIVNTSHWELEPKMWLTV